MTIRTAKVYDIIDGKAGSNIAMQGLSGLMGFPFTAVMDITVFFTHYGPMLNDIRAVYSRPPIGKDELRHIVKGCRQDLLADMVLDKLIGNIPILGLPANMICARAMTAETKSIPNMCFCQFALSNPSFRRRTPCSLRSQPY